MVLNILCVSYFLSSTAMPDLQSSDMRHLGTTVHVSALSGISYRLNKL